MIRSFLILMLLAAPLLRAEPATAELTAAGVTEFTAAYKEWSGGRFATASEQFRHATVRPDATVTNFYWLGVSEFHRMLQLRDEPTNAVPAAAALEVAMVALATALEHDADHAESHALLGTLYGMKIKGSFVRAAWFGPRVAKHQSGALKAGAANPRVQYLLGMGRFHTATKRAAWEEALATLLTAEKLFAAEATTTAAPLAPRWGHDSCLTFIGRTYELLGHRPEAVEYFRKALALHPADHIAQAGLKRLAPDRPAASSGQE